jgi:hypothetical protein
MYSAAHSAASATHPKHADFQGAWQVGVMRPGTSRSGSFVIHAAPGTGPLKVSFKFQPGQPSDGGTAIPTGSQPGAWRVTLPGTTSVDRSSNALVRFSVSVPASAKPGSYTGTIVATASNGQTMRIPVYAAVPLHDTRSTAGIGGAQARITSGRDVFAKGDTVWPSVLGVAGGTLADWLVYPVELPANLAQARFSVYDAAAGDETYDLYLYDAGFNLLASSHPFAPAGVTDVPANDARGPSTKAAPQLLVRSNPAAGRYYVAVNRARIGGTTTGDFGAFVLTLDEIARP